MNSPASSPMLLRMRGVTKRFGATQALRGVSFDVEAGQVVALIGENGAGKSTLMKVLSGAVSPDAGQMSVEGSPYRPRGPGDARRAGISMIYQELNLAPDLSVEDNMMLGQESRSWGLLRRGAQRRKVRAALDVLGHHELQPHVAVRALSTGARQLVEIARALVMDARIVVFDEPTSSLTRHDVEHLFEVIGKLRDAGIGIVYISHFLEEIRDIGSHYAVLRDGESVGTGRLDEITEPEIVSLMVGREVSDLFPRVPHEPGAEILALHGLHGQQLPRDVNMSLRRGEILGIAGLVGAGRTEMLRVVFALDPVRQGKVIVDGNVPRHSPGARIRAGLGMVSEDRKGEGLAQQRSIADNITYSRMAPYSRWGILDLPRRAAAVRQWMEKLQVKAAGGEQDVSALSGGNQQKIAIARVMHQDADVLLLDEPTRGIDVGTKAEIYRLVGQMAAQGKAVIFVSSYLPELLAICDRIGVMSRGELREIRPRDQWTEESVMARAIM